MLTDFASTFEIVQTGGCSLVCCHTGTAQKMLYRQFESLSPCSMHKIQRMGSICHPNILRLFKVEKGPRQNVGSPAPSRTLGVQLQYYTGSMVKYLGARNSAFEEEEIINTFGPVEEAVGCLLAAGWKFTGLGLHNIVITEAMEIKYIDDCILEPGAEQAPELLKQEVYQQIAMLMFEFLKPERPKPKSWKGRLKVLKSHCSKETYSYFMSVYGKSLVNPCDAGKTKRISKKMNRKLSGGSGLKLKKEAGYCVEGKENKIGFKN